MFSMPPATTMSTSPARIICDAIATALRPDPQTMLIVVAGTSLRDSGADRDLACWVLSKPGGEDTAEHDLVYFLAGDLRLLERGPDRGGTELGGRDILELAAEATDRCPHGADDHSIFHHSLLGRRDTENVTVTASIRSILASSASFDFPPSCGSVDRVSSQSLAGQPPASTLGRRGVRPQRPASKPPSSGVSISTSARSRVTSGAGSPTALCGGLRRHGPAVLRE